MFTVYGATGRDFQIVVLDGYCIDLDDSVHDNFMHKYFKKK